MQYSYSESTILADLFEHIANEEVNGWSVAQLGAYGVTTPDPTGGYVTSTTHYVYMYKESE